MKTSTYIFVLTADYQVSCEDGTFGKFIMTCCCSEKEANLLCGALQAAVEVAKPALVSLSK